MILMSYEDLQARCDRIADECRRSTGSARLLGYAHRVETDPERKRPHAPTVTWDYEGEARFSITVTFTAVTIVRELPDLPVSRTRWPIWAGDGEWITAEAVRFFGLWRDSLETYEARMLEKHWLLSRHPVRQRWWTERVFASMQLLADPRLAACRDDG